MTESTSHIFVSYASLDRERVQPVVAALDAAGVHVWFDRTGIAAGESYGPEIVAALRSSAALVLCCSAAAFASRNVRQELALAWKHELPVLPLLLEATAQPDEVAYWLEGCQWIELLDHSVDEWLPEVLRALGRLGVVVASTAAPPPVASSMGTWGTVRLPAPLTALLGRDVAVSEIAELLTDHRLVTLLGPGGVGKTRLAVDAARSASPVFPDGVTFIDLSSLRDPGLVLPTIGQNLGVPDAPGASLPSTLAAAVGERRTLLVLDNCEQVVEAAPEVAALLARCPRLAILATSRVALAIRGEQSFAVEPLTVVAPGPGVTPDHLAASPAVALFVARAAEVRPTFALSEENAPVVTEICRRLDGLPLAIELAAARVRLLSPEALLGKMTQRLPLLTGGARDLPDRQRTLREAIAWSHDPLDEDERTLFRRLSVFAGGCGFEAIEAVCNPAGAFELLDLLGALVDKNLVRQEGAEDEPAFRMLETIREFAGEQLEASGEGLVVRRSHLDYYAAIADAAAAALRGHNQLAWLRRLDDDRENLRTALAGALERREQEPALRLASALFRFWHMRGDLSEGRDWLERALAGREGHSRVRGEALNLACMMAWSQGDIARGGMLADEAYAAALACGDRTIEAFALLNQGVAAGPNLNASRFVSRLEAALRLFRDLGDSWGTGLALGLLGGFIGIPGNGASDDLARSTRFLREANELFRNLGDGRMIAWTLMALSRIETRNGATQEATTLLHEAIRLQRMGGFRYDLPLALHRLGWNRLGDDDLDAAAAAFNDALALARDTGNEMMQAGTLVSLGRVAQLRGDTNGAVINYAEGLRLAQENLHVDEVVLAYQDLAEILVGRGRAEEAARLLGAIDEMALSNWASAAERTRHESIVNAVRTSLGEDAFHRARALGRTIGEHAFIAEALEIAASLRDERGGEASPSHAAPTLLK